MRSTGCYLSSDLHTLLRPGATVSMTGPTYVSDDRLDFVQIFLDVTAGFGLALALGL